MTSFRKDKWPCAFDNADGCCHIRNNHIIKSMLFDTMIGQRSSLKITFGHQPAKKIVVDNIYWCWLSTDVQQTSDNNYMQFVTRIIQANISKSL